MALPELIRVIQIEIPEAFEGLYEPYRYKAFYGGRGSAKSHSFATALLDQAARKPLRVLAAREVQKSIAESVKQLLDDKIDAMNISRLIKGVRSMSQLKYSLEHPEPTTPALTLGIATHLAVFEPASFEKRVLKAPKCDRRTTKGKADWAEFQKLLTGNEIALDVDDFACVIGMRDSMLRCKAVKEMMDSPGQGELAAVWKDETTGIICKGMVDRLTMWRGWSVVPDLKTCLDGSPEGFARAIGNNHYHTKAAWYSDGLNELAKVERRFIWIAVEKEPPYDVAMYEPDDDTLAEGRKVYRRLLNEYASCKITGLWPSYPEGIQPIRLPKYHFQRLEIA